MTDLRKIDSQMPLKEQVVIVGAGPVGLMAALILQRHGVPLTIIDKRAQRVKTSNSLIILPRTLEVFDDLGLSSEILAAGNKIDASCLHLQKGVKVFFEYKHLPSIYPFILVASQSTIEEILGKHFESGGGIVNREFELVKVVSNASDVQLKIKNNDKFIDITTEWLIASDGSRSYTRQSLRLPAKENLLNENFVLCDFEGKSTLASNNYHMIAKEDGFLNFVPYSDHQFRVVSSVLGDSEFDQKAPLNLEQLRALIHKRYPNQIEVKDLNWSSTFKVREMLMDSYREHQIFFAGDASHVHSPAGGQGMNLGIQDSYNLGWKLALVIQKLAKSSILDTYNSERQPVARAVLTFTAIQTRVLLMRNRFLQKMRDFLLKLFFIKNKRFSYYLSLKATHLTVRYHNSPLTKNLLDKHFSGARFRDCRLNDQTYLLDHLRGKLHCLLIFTDSNFHSELETIQNLIKISYSKLIKPILISGSPVPEGWQGDFILDSNSTIRDLYQIHSPSLLLVRPDKYFSFCAPLKDVHKLREYLSTYYHTKG